MSVDKERFTELMRAAGFRSQRELAKHMSGRDGGPMDHASLSRILSGDRDILFSEAIEISERFSAPLQEIAEIFFGKKRTVFRKKLKSA